MKKLILVLFSLSFFLIACDNSVCNKNNYQEYVFNQEKMDQLIAKGKSCNLKKADLVGANLEDADLRNANLKGANLQRANLSGANLSGADFRENEFVRSGYVRNEASGNRFYKCKI